MKCAIFDMDGTLINSEKKYFECWQSFLESCGYEITVDFYQRVLGSPTHELKPLFLAEYGNAFPFDQLFQRVMLHRQDYVNSVQFALTPGALAFLQACRATGIVCGLATSSPRAEAQRILERLKVWDFFAFTAFGNEVKKGKPDPEIFQLAAARSGYAKGEIVVFEDSTNGVLAAHRAGLTVYHLNDFIPIAEEIAHLPAASYQDFNEILADCHNQPGTLPCTSSLF